MKWQSSMIWVVVVDRPAMVTVVLATWEHGQCPVQYPMSLQTPPDHSLQVRQFCGARIFVDDTNHEFKNITYICYTTKILKPKKSSAQENVFLFTKSQNFVPTKINGFTVNSVIFFKKFCRCFFNSACSKIRIELYKIFFSLHSYCKDIYLLYFIILLITYWEKSSFNLGVIILKHSIHKKDSGLKHYPSKILVQASSAHCIFSSVFTGVWDFLSFLQLLACSPYLVPQVHYVVTPESPVADVQHFTLHHLSGLPLQYQWPIHLDHRWSRFIPLQCLSSWWLQIVKQIIV